MKFFRVKTQQEHEHVCAADSAELLRAAHALKEGEQIVGRCILGECIGYQTGTKLLDIVELTRDELAALAPESLKLFEEEVSNEANN